MEKLPILNVDNHFSMGKSHLVCEDYTLSGVTNNLTWYIVCDGCSSAEKSDVGARILAHVASQHIEEFFNAEDKQAIAIQCGGKARALLEGMGLSRWQLMATMHIGIADPNTNTAMVLSMGDGFDFYQFTNGDVLVRTRDYIQNAPYYVGYLLEEKDNRYYLSMDTGEPNYTPNVGGFCLERTYLNGKLKEERECYEPIFLTCHVHQLSDLTKFGSVTDGADSFKGSTSLVVQETPVSIIQQLLTIANPSKGFMKRRLNKMLVSVENKGSVPTDDIGVAVITVQNTNE